MLTYTLHPNQCNWGFIPVIIHSYFSSILSSLCLICDFFAEKSSIFSRRLENVFSELVSLWSFGNTAIDSLFSCNVFINLHFRHSIHQKSGQKFIFLPRYFLHNNPIVPFCISWISTFHWYT